MEKLAYYIHCLTNLNYSKSKGFAPNKPILFLALVKLIEKRIINHRFIEVSPELLESFLTLWGKLVEEDRERIFALPFFHMRSEKFWELVPNRGFEKTVANIGTIRSLSRLQKLINGAFIDKELLLILQDKVQREVVVDAILNTYFPNTKQYYCNEDKDLFSSIRLDEDPEAYRIQIVQLKKELDKNEYQEQIFIRSGAFKRKVSQIYSDTCAISGMKVTSTSNFSMIDACHIVPFSESYDDTLSNGIALTPTLHRAFDRGLISISEDYRVLINKNFKENGDSPYRLSQFEGRNLHLPHNQEHYPSLLNLQSHRKRFSF